MAGPWCLTIDYRRRGTVSAGFAQMPRTPYYSLTQLAAYLTSLLPNELSRVFFVNSGSEAVETALKMARQYARRAHPGQNRYKVIARHRAYHGFTMGALSATGQAPRR